MSNLERWIGPAQATSQTSSPRPRGRLSCQVDISFRSRDGLLTVSDHRFFEAVAQMYNATRAVHILYTVRPNVTGRIKLPERELAFRVDHATRIGAECTVRPCSWP
jgi:hypothetical protein